MEPNVPYWQVKLAPFAVVMEKKEVRSRVEMPGSAFCFAPDVCYLLTLCGLVADWSEAGFFSRVLILL